MKPFLSAALALCLAACATETVAPPAIGDDSRLFEDPWGAEGPPVMGFVAAELAGSAQRWTTYDFSIGAFSASAWMHEVPAGVELRIMAYQPGQWDVMERRINLTGTLPSLAPGQASDAVFALLMEEAIDGPRLEGPAVLRLTRIEREGDEVYGKAAGDFSAEICPSGGMEDGPCLPISGRFETEVQFDNM
ncbi:hypothetical protein [Pelagovum pacificum]|uniref:Lipoprotein n=1 Tax=Pelagovum pacificum TaxID=2588711 RepID=A0A5C5GDB3_9RHOB|nr:hypothetical protein [Pelagovum pacificum]QQA41221.1 hypothetical protein I8N54_10295 [Pelagovum pacificum]TNY31971.1 hypothetical protein FHY64_01305 [Pelagovum pacificum]